MCSGAIPGKSPLFKIDDFLSRTGHWNDLGAHSFPQRPPLTIPRQALGPKRLLKCFQKHSECNGTKKNTKKWTCSKHTENPSNSSQICIFGVPQDPKELSKIPPGPPQDPLQEPPRPSWDPPGPHQEPPRTSKNPPQGPPGPSKDPPGPPMDPPGPPQGLSKILTGTPRTP